VQEEIPLHRAFLYSIWFCTPTSTRTIWFTT